MTEDNNHPLAGGLRERIHTIQLARRLGLNPAYVKSAEYVEDGDKKRVVVEMRSFEVRLSDDFVPDDDRYQLPDVVLHMGNRSKNECYCLPVPGPHADRNVWNHCAACTVVINRDEEPEPTTPAPQLFYVGTEVKMAESGERGTVVEVDGADPAAPYHVYFPKSGESGRWYRWVPAEALTLATPL